MKLPKSQDKTLYVYGILNSVHVWALILAVLGFAKRHLNFANGFLKYANQAVYPFYILHQTLIVALGYYVVQWPCPIIFKLCILVALCFLILITLYQFIIKPYTVPRLLFGLKLKQMSGESSDACGGRGVMSHDSTESEQGPER